MRTPLAGLDARRLAVEVAGAGDQSGRDDAVLDGVLRAVDVGEKHLERAHALLDARLDVNPLGLVDDARHGVERERPLLAREVEGDALGEVRARESIRSTAQLVLSHLGERGVQLLVRRASGTRGWRTSRPTQACPVPLRGGGAIAIEQVCHALSLRCFCCRGVSRRAKSALRGEHDRSAFALRVHPRVGLGHLG